MNDAIDKILRSRHTTCLFVAHRLSTIARAERIVVLEGCTFLYVLYLPTLLTCSPRWTHHGDWDVSRTSMYPFGSCITRADLFTCDTGSAREFALPRSHGCATQYRRWGTRPCGWRCSHGTSWRWTWRGGQVEWGGSFAAELGRWRGGCIS